jgi:hypothetical protein
MFNGAALSTNFNKKITTNLKSVFPTYSYRNKVLIASKNGCTGTSTTQAEYIARIR